MVIRLRTAFIIGIIFIILTFLYIERSILTPFILAGLFAYIFNPIVNFFSNRIKIPRIISVSIIYVLIIAVLIGIFLFLVRRSIYESTQLTNSVSHFITATKTETTFLPDWIRPSVENSLSSIQSTKWINNSIFVFFPKAISGILSLFVFIFSSFYFLKEGSKMMNKLLVYVPRNYKLDVEILLKRINLVLNGYLRGQIFLVFLVSFALYISLSILGVRFALILAILSGFAEIVPIVGPIFAATVAVIATILGGGANFGLTSVQTSILVVIIYFVLRQIEDYFVIPIVMGKITKLHPIIILFAVLVGGHTAGVLGLIIAVPVAATLKLFLDFSVDTINKREIEASKK